jgi:hypothetical protein
MHTFMSTLGWMDTAVIFFSAKVRMDNLRNLALNSQALRIRNLLITITFQKQSPGSGDEN